MGSKVSKPPTGIFVFATVIRPEEVLFRLFSRKHPFGAQAGQHTPLVNILHGFSVVGITTTAHTDIYVQTCRANFLGGLEHIL